MRVTYTPKNASNIHQVTILGEEFDSSAILKVAAIELIAELAPELRRRRRGRRRRRFEAADLDVRRPSSPPTEVFGGMQTLKYEKMKQRLKTLRRFFFFCDAYSREARKKLRPIIRRCL